MSLNKDEYLQGLKDAGVEDEPVVAKPDEVTDRVEPEPTSTEPAPTPAESVPVEPVATAPAPDAAPAVVPAPEPFPGFNALPAEAQKLWADREEQNKALARDLERARVEREQLHHRVAPTQQKTAKLETELAQYKKRLAEIESRNMTAESKKKLEAFKAAYPEEAEGIEAYSEMLRLEQQQNASEISQLKGIVENLRQQQAGVTQDAAIMQERQALTAAHPDWQTQVNSDNFRIWRENLPPEDREHIEPLLRSLKASDNIHVLNQFKRDLSYADALNRVQQNATPTSATPPGAKVPDLVPDPAPVRRTTAPNSPATETPAGQPISKAKQEFIEAAEYFERRRKAGLPISV